MVLWCFGGSGVVVGIKVFWCYGFMVGLRPERGWMNVVVGEDGKRDQPEPERDFSLFPDFGCG